MTTCITQKIPVVPSDNKAECLHTEHLAASSWRNQSFAGRGEFESPFEQLQKRGNKVYESYAASNPRALLVATAVFSWPGQKTNKLDTCIEMSGFLFRPDSRYTFIAHLIRSFGPKNYIPSPQPRYVCPHLTTVDDSSRGRTIFLCERYDIVLRMCLLLLSSHLMTIIYGRTLHLCTAARAGHMQDRSKESIQCDVHQPPRLLLPVLT